MSPFRIKKPTAPVAAPEVIVPPAPTAPVEVPTIKTKPEPKVKSLPYRDVKEVTFTPFNVEVRALRQEGGKLFVLKADGTEVATDKALVKAAVQLTVNGTRFEKGDELLADADTLRAWGQLLQTV